jgi:hypothetical protein
MVEAICTECAIDGRIRASTYHVILTSSRLEYQSSERSSTEIWRRYASFGHGRRRRAMRSLEIRGFRRLTPRIGLGVDEEAWARSRVGICVCSRRFRDHLANLSAYIDWLLEASQRSDTSARSGRDILTNSHESSGFPDVPAPSSSPLPVSPDSPRRTMSAPHPVTVLIVCRI